MASSKWKSFQELNTILKNRDFVFWGATNWIERTMSKFDHKPKFIIDKSSLNQGIVYNGYDVKSPNEINSIDKPFIIITTANYISVIDDLQKLGFIMGDDFCCTPLLNERKYKDELLNHAQSLLISSPKHHITEESGGGLYKVNLNPFEINKVYSGKVRGVSKFDGNYYVIDMLKGLVILDHNFKKIDLVKLPMNCEPHGIYIDDERMQVFVGTPGRDSILVYSLDKYELVNEYFISNKWSLNKKDNHHVNDPFVFGDSLYVSMFSFSGNWMNEVYDGGILEIDLSSGKIIGPVMSGMWMPHSVTRIDGKLTFLNSMLGELYQGSYDISCKTNGFARGLAHDGKYFYIGTTEHRYPEKLRGVSNNISLDTGFYIFDSTSKLSKFYSLDSIEAIHSIVTI